MCFFYIQTRTEQGKKHTRTHTIDNTFVEWERETVYARCAMCMCSVKVEKRKTLFVVLFLLLLLLLFFIVNVFLPFHLFTGCAGVVTTVWLSYLWLSLAICAIAQMCECRMLFTIFLLIAWWLLLLLLLQLLLPVPYKQCTWHTCITRHCSATQDTRAATTKATKRAREKCVHKTKSIVKCVHIAHANRGIYLTRVR